MRVLSKKTTILFSPQLYQQLEEIAKTTHTSVARLIRQAVVKQYLLADKKSRLEAVEHLAKISAPVSDWKTMEEESIRGHLNGI